MKPIERAIVGIESGMWSAVSRGGVGFVMPPVFRTLSGNSDSVWVNSALFLGVLIALRFVPMALRYILPFSAEAKEVWRARRELSKKSDAYAWQKLFWVGLGLLLYGAVGGGLQRGEFAVTLFCLISGGAGLLVWCTTRGTQPVQ
jgi:hypothetical protein